MKCISKDQIKLSQNESQSQTTLSILLYLYLLWMNNYLKTLTPHHTEVKEEIKSQIHYLLTQNLIRKIFISCADQVIFAPFIG